VRLDALLFLVMDRPKGEIALEIWRARRACWGRLPGRLAVRTLRRRPGAAKRSRAARGLDGVVSKRRDAPYWSGDCRDWRKVKTQAWREANRERWRLFERA